MSAMTERCRSCFYYTSDYGHFICPTCDYILIEGHRRGCPAGDECDKFLPKKDCIKYTSAVAGLVRLPVREQQLFDLYEQGKTDVAIAKALNISRQAVAKWRNKNGLSSQVDLRERISDED